MAGPFETATRAAIEDLIQSHSKLSKFGMVLTHENTQQLIDALFELLLTSRNLKSMGDRMLQGPPQRSEPKPRPSPFGKKVTSMAPSSKPGENRIQKDMVSPPLRERSLGRKIPL